MLLLMVFASTCRTKKVNPKDKKGGGRVDDKEGIKSHCNHNIRPSKELFLNLQWHLLFDQPEAEKQVIFHFTGDKSIFLLQRMTAFNFFFYLSEFLD